MEQARRFYGISSSELRAMGKRTLEWDLNGWKWDGDLFIPSPLDPNHRGEQFIPLSVPLRGNSSNSSSFWSDDVQIQEGKRDLERERRVIMLDDNSLDDETDTLTLKLGGYPLTGREVIGHMEGTIGTKTKSAGGSTSHAICQVEDCGADLSSAKDYHRRHKVCEMHSKAGKALVGNMMQRFCQQCSRFHALQEFDGGKRSCRRRLAGHNKRRRKTQPDADVASGQSINDEQASNYILISLLRILSTMHVNNRSDQTTDQDLVAHLLRSRANQSGMHGGKDISGLLHESRKLVIGGTPIGNSEMTSAFISNAPQFPPGPTGRHLRVPTKEIPLKGLHTFNNGGRVAKIASSRKPGIVFHKDSPPAYSEARDSDAGKAKLNNFDLNEIYIDSDDGVEDLESFPVAGNFETGSLDCP